LDKTEEKRWRRTSPFAAIFYLGKIFKAISQNAVQTLAPGAAFLFAYEGDLMSRVVLGLTAFVIIVIALAFFRYWFFRFQIGSDSILIREGVLKKKQLDIKFERIQAINTTQNVIFRPFDLVTVQLDTAGSAKQEGYLPAIRSQLANDLKSRLREKTPSKILEFDEVSDDAGDSRLVLSLTKFDMIRIGLSSRNALIILAVLSPLLNNIGERIEKIVDESTILALLNNAGISVAGGIGLAISGIVLLLLILAGASILGAFLRFYNYELRSEHETLRSTGGLLTRHEHSVSLNKIQSLRADQNPVLRLFNRFRVRAKQASSGKRPDEGNQFIIPICKPMQLPLLGEEVFADEFPEIELDPLSSDWHPISRSYIRSRFILFGVLPTTVVAPFFYPLIGAVALAFLVWLPIAALWVWTSYRKHGYNIAENGVMLRRGLLGYQSVAFLHRKIQRISVTQTKLQERKGLATVRFYLASGSLRLPYIDYRLAKELRDYILYKVESSRYAWH